MKAPLVKPVRCAIYTRVSTEHGLDQEFNSLDAQYEAASAYIKSQAHAGWTLIRSRYDDGGYSGGSTERPDLQRLLNDIRARKIDVIVVYKVDRLTRSLADFAKLVELFDAHGVSFVSAIQQFNTTTSIRSAWTQSGIAPRSWPMRQRTHAATYPGLLAPRRPSMLDELSQSLKPPKKALVFFPTRDFFGRASSLSTLPPPMIT